MPCHPMRRDDRGHPMSPPPHAAQNAASICVVSWRLGWASNMSLFSWPWQSGAKKWRPSSHPSPRRPRSAARPPAVTSKVSTGASKKLYQSRPRTVARAADTPCHSTPRSANCSVELRCELTSQGKQLVRSMAPRAAGVVPRVSTDKGVYGGGVVRDRPEYSRGVPRS